MKGLYKDCSELPIYNFYRLIETKDLSLLCKDEDAMEDYTDEELYNHLITIIREYHELVENKDLLLEYKALLDIEYMSFRFAITKKILALYLESEDLEVFLTLRDLNWRIDPTKSINDQIARINKSLIGLKNKLKIAQSNFIRKYRKNEKETNPNFNLEEQVINLEVNLPLSYRIDIHKDSIKRFVIWNDILRSKYKKLNNG